MFFLTTRVDAGAMMKRLVDSKRVIGGL
jgi:hypothetical protein